MNKEMSSPSNDTVIEKSSYRSETESVEKRPQMDIKRKPLQFVSETEKMRAKEHLTEIGYYHRLSRGE